MEFLYRPKVKMDSRLRGNDGARRRVSACNGFERDVRANNGALERMTAHGKAHTKKPVHQHRLFK
jgi:hypothetical protein